MVQGCRRYGVARLFVYGNTLPGQRRFIDRAAALQHNAVHGYIFPGPHHKNVAFSDLVDGHLHLFSVPDDHGCLRCQLHQPFERVRGLPLGMGLQHLSDRNQGQNHSGGLKIEFMHVRHDACHIAVHLCRRHGKKRIQAVSKRCCRTKRHQRIHIGGPMNQPFEAADEKLLVDHHDDARQQKLGDSDSHMILRQRLRQRPVPHHMSHGQIHQRNQETERGNQPPPNLRRLRILQKIVVRSRGGGAGCGSAGASSGTGAGASGALDRGAVARRLHGGDDGRLVRRAFHSHRVCQKAYGTGGHSRHFGDSLFHSRAAGRTAHTCHVILFHNLSSSLCADFLSAGSRKIPGAMHRFRPAGRTLPRSLRSSTTSSHHFIVSSFTASVSAALSPIRL